MTIHINTDIRDLQTEMYMIAFDHGFHSGDGAKTPLEEVCLWMTECAEAAEETRTGMPLDRVYYKVTPTVEHMNDSVLKPLLEKVQAAARKAEHFGVEKVDESDMPTDDEWHTLVMAGAAKPEGFGVEAADAVIRIMDSLQAHGIDLAEMIALKSAYNRTRPMLHGKTK